MPEIIQDNTVLGNPLHEWTIQEYEQYERTPRWYWLMGFIGVISLIYALLTGNFLFALVIILFAIILYLQSHQAPAQLPFVITDLGVIVGRHFHAYSEMEKFFLIYRPPEVKMLFFQTKSVLQPLIRIPLLDVDPVEIRFSLLQFLAEDTEREDEPLSDQIARNLRLQ